MKSVWILEGFTTREQIDMDLKNFKKIVENAVTEEEKRISADWFQTYQKIADENPEGYWTGYQGKTNYRQFCECAKETLRNMKERGMKWRVIKGQIPDNAQYWNGYKNNPVEVKDAVMRYLWATLDI